MSTQTSRLSTGQLRFLCLYPTEKLLEVLDLCCHNFFLRIMWVLRVYIPFHFTDASNSHFLRPCPLSHPHASIADTSSPRKTTKRAAHDNMPMGLWITANGHVLKLLLWLFTLKGKSLHTRRWPPSTLENALHWPIWYVRVPSQFPTIALTGKEELLHTVAATYLIGPIEKIETNLAMEIGTWWYYFLRGAMFYMTTLYDRKHYSISKHSSPNSSTMHCKWKGGVQWHNQFTTNFTNFTSDLDQKRLWQLHSTVQQQNYNLKLQPIVMTSKESTATDFTFKFRNFYKSKNTATFTIIVESLNNMVIFSPNDCVECCYSCQDLENSKRVYRRK